MGKTKELDFKNKLFKHNLMIFLMNLSGLILCVILFTINKYYFHIELQMINVICVSVITCCTYTSFIELYKTHIDIQCIKEMLETIQELRNNIMECENE